MPSGGPSPIGIAAISASRTRRAGCGWGGSAVLPPGAAGPVARHQFHTEIQTENRRENYKSSTRTNGELFYL